MKTTLPTPLKPLRYLTIVAMVALINACGGGGGGSPADNSAVQAATGGTPAATGTTPTVPAVTITAAVGTGTEPTTGLTNAQAKDMALTLWRNDDLSVHPKGSCAGCHGADFFDLARIGSTDTDLVRRATIDGASPKQAQALVQAIKAVRGEMNLPVQNARTFRPLQPGGSVLLPELTDSAEPDYLVAVKRDVAFAQQIKTLKLLPSLTEGRIDSLEKAKKAQKELLDLAQGTNDAGSNAQLFNMRTLPSGILYPKWSADVHHGAKEGTFNDWTADIAHDTKDAANKLEWQALQSAYLANPSNLNFWKMYNEARNKTFVPLFNCTLTDTNDTTGAITPSSTCFKTDDFNKNKFLSALMGQHMMRLDYTGKLNTFAKGAVAFSYLDNPTEEAFSVMKTRENFPMLPSALWEVGDTGRTMLISDNLKGSFKANLASLGFPVFAQNSIDPVRSAVEEEDSIRLAWFWIGATFDPSMSRINKSNATRVGEYMLGTLIENRYFNHNALSTLMRLATKGSLPEANAVKTGATTLRYEQPKFLMEYGYAWAYGRATLTDNVWNENKIKGIVIPPELKETSNSLYGALMGNGFRMSMYLQMEQLAETAAPKALTTTQLTQLRDEWLNDSINTNAPGSPLRKGGLCSIYLHFKKHSASSLVEDEALMESLRVSAGVPTQTWKTGCGY